MTQHPEEAPLGGSVQFMNPDGLPKNPSYTNVVGHHPELCVEVGSKYTNRDMTLTERRPVPRPYTNRH